MRAATPRIAGTLRPWLSRLAFAASVTVALPISSPSPLAAQEDDTFEDLFSSYLGPNGEGYLKPAAEVLGASLNSGLVGPARIRPGFHLRLGFEMANSFIGDDQRTFRASTEGAFRPLGTVDAPTIVGDPNPVYLEGDAGTAYIFPAGLAVDRVGVVIPELTIGSVMGTEATVRFFAFSPEDVGDFSLLGLGVRHSISQYLSENPPVDIAAGLFYHTVKLTDVADVTALLASVQASLTRSVFTFYGGLGYEQSSMEVEYDSERAESGRVRFDLDGATGVRATAGVALGLSILKLHADVSAGTQTVLNIGIGFGN